MPRSPRTCSTSIRPAPSSEGWPISWPAASIPRRCRRTAPATRSSSTASPTAASSTGVTSVTRTATASIRPCSSRSPQRAATAAGVDIFGGDVIVGPSGELTLIDLNDWPSFAPCRDAGAGAIAGYLTRRVHAVWHPVSSRARTKALFDEEQQLSPPACRRSRCCQSWRSRTAAAQAHRSRRQDVSRPERRRVGGEPWSRPSALRRRADRQLGSGDRRQLHLAVRAPELVRLIAELAPGNLSARSFSAAAPRRSKRRSGWRGPTRSGPTSSASPAAFTARRPACCRSRMSPGSRPSVRFPRGYHLARYPDPTRFDGTAAECADAAIASLRRRDRSRAPAGARGGHRRADSGHRRQHHPARRVSRPACATSRRARRAAHRRRDDHRLRPHRRDVRVDARRRRARHLTVGKGMGAGIPRERGVFRRTRSWPPSRTRCQARPRRATAAIPRVGRGTGDDQDDCRR